MQKGVIQNGDGLREEAVGMAFCFWFSERKINAAILFGLILILCFLFLSFFFFLIDNPLFSWVSKICTSLAERARERGSQNIRGSFFNKRTYLCCAVLCCAR